MLGRNGAGPPGQGSGECCVCPSCGTRIPHKLGEPCFDVNCPKCDTKMVRK